VTVLARVGEQLYWASRYLERAEGVARVLREHTHLLIDLPTSVPLTWEPLLEMTGDRPARGFAPGTGEAAVVRFLVWSADNPGGIAVSVGRAREDLRGCREVIPTEAWEVVNDLHLSMASRRGEGVDRRGRARLLDRVIADHQRYLGILLGTMSRDLAFTLMRLGRHIERAALTTRVLDVRAASLIGPSDRERYEDVQWIGVLRSLSALHMYHRATTEPVSAEGAMRFLLLDPVFPRSVAHCLTSVLQTAGQLPVADRVLPACHAALEVLEGLDPAGRGPAHLHAGARALGDAVAVLHDAVMDAYFPPVAVAGA
jgi:uncharacterized alpha-E superfamily protein